MITGNHEVLSLQKDKVNVVCCTPEAELMSMSEPIEIGDCSVTMSFAEKADPTIGQAVAEMLIESYMRRCGA